MSTSCTLTFGSGTRIIVPDSLNLITTYVMREQRDWFEDEIRFLRRLLRKGQTAIDIGANYGVYTLTMAELVGAAGRIWAFEPASRTAGYLADSLAANAFEHVILERKALSCRKGNAQLSLNENAELNAIIQGDETEGITETVAVVTLDACMAELGWHNIDFLKLDAEGEESNILKGGRRFFDENSPLVQYEIKAGDDFHFELVDEFAEMGYSSYRLVPGINVLVPFNASEPTDDYQLNLFSCKSDRAARLADDGYLVKLPVDRRSEEIDSDTGLGKLDNGAYLTWLAELAQTEYGKIFADDWREMVSAGRCKEMEAALSLYATSRFSSSSGADRFLALEQSFTQLRSLCKKEPKYLRLSSLARVARDYGARRIAVKALGQLFEFVSGGGQVDPREPFLVPGERFDSVAPRASVADWIAAAALEEFERAAAYSSYYAGKTAVERLTVIRDLGFGGDEMHRRLDLVRQRFNVTD